MNLAKLQEKLIAAARSNPPGDNVPYAFEKRIMAVLASKPAPDPLLYWARGLTRAAVFCVLAALLMGGTSLFLPSSNADSLSQDVETTLLAAVDNSNPIDSVTQPE